MTKAGFNVVAIERGPWRDTATDFPPGYAPDELRYAVRHDLFVRPAQTTLTFRNNPSQAALPVRTWGAFLLPNGVGGAGVHWNAQTWRFLPTDFVLKTHLTQRYGANFLPEDMTIQDWGVTYDELEPHYDTFEYLCGTSGNAGNLKGQKQPFGNPWEGPRSRPYPTPAQKQNYGPVLWAEAAKEMGYSPFAQPSGNLSQAYTNPLGVTLGPCTYCGFCERFGCGNYSKASSQTTILPLLMRRTNFEARTECEVTRINLDNTGKRATGVIYVDTAGREWEQPAEMIFLCAFHIFNVQLLLLSGIGQPYDPNTGQGVIGRNFSYQVTSSVEAFFDNKIFNTPSFRAAPSACASTSSMATISTTFRTVSSVAALWEWCRRTRGRSRRPRPRRARRNGARRGRRRSRTITSARSCRRRTGAATATATATSIWIHLQGSVRPA